MAEINRKYWDDFTKVLPEETFRIWNVNHLTPFLITLGFGQSSL